MCNEIIEALKQLTGTVGKHSFLWEFISTVLATLGSVVAVYASERVKERYITPLKEFKQLRSTVSMMLDLYACNYTNQIDCANENDPRLEEYKNAAFSLRELAVKLGTFAINAPQKQYYGITVQRMMKAKHCLIGLSNSFFTPYRRPEANTNLMNLERSTKIKELLGIDQMK